MTASSDLVLLAVNGTLMRGLELNPNLLAVGASFIRETRTEPAYRLWSISDRHPAMIRVRTGGVSVGVEVWAVPAAGLASILLKEPAGLSIVQRLSATNLSAKLERLLVSTNYLTFVGLDDKKYSFTAEERELILKRGKQYFKDRKSTRLNSSHVRLYRMPSSA